MQKEEVTELSKKPLIMFFINTQQILTYTKNKKKDFTGTKISGWISLCQYKNGGGWFDDKYTLFVEDIESEE